MQSFFASFVQACDAPARDIDRAQAPDMRLPAGAGSPARTQATESLTRRWPHLPQSQASIAIKNFQLLPQLPRLCSPSHPSGVTPRELPDNFSLATRSDFGCLATCLACCARVPAVAGSAAEWQTA